MLKIDLKPFEITDLSHILHYPIRFVSLEFKHSKLTYCSLLFSHSTELYTRKHQVRFRGKYFQSETILLPVETTLVNLSAYDCCCIQTADSDSRSGLGLHPAEESILLRYAHI